MPKKTLILIIPALLIVFALIFYRKEIFILVNSRGYDSSKQTAVFNDVELKIPTELTQTTLSNFNSKLAAVLGSSSKEKRIEIDLTEQKLYAYEGDEKKMSFDISSGKWGRTPTGEFRIWIKLKYTLMTGGVKELGTYYYLPNVPFTMYFYKDFGIHGAYRHDNFGHPMSHGCINMRPSEAEQLFYWANPSVPDDVNSVLSSGDNEGTRVIIYGTAPNE